MAESLGDALLSLRTDDAQFNAGVTRAEGKARALGGTLDKTSGSATRLSTGLTGAGRSADAMGVGFERGGQRVLASAGAQRAGMLQLGQQVNDVATMYALGARPTQIFASQIGQVTQAINLATGGTSALARFLGGPWGVALTAATVVLAPFIAKLFETKDAAAEMRSELEKALKALNDTLAQPSAFGSTLTAAGKQRIDALGREAQLQREIAAQEEKRQRSQTGTGIKTAGEVQAELELKRLRGQLVSAQKDIRAADDAVAEARLIEKVRGIQDANKAVLDAKPERAPTDRSSSARRAAERELASLVDRLLPDEASIRKRAEEIALLEQAAAKGKISVEELDKALDALRGEGIDQNRRLEVSLGGLDSDNQSLTKFGDVFGTVAEDFADATARELEENAALREAFTDTFSDGIMAALNGDLRGFLFSFFNSILRSALDDALSGISASLFSQNSGGGGLLGAVFGIGKSIFGPDPSASLQGDFAGNVLGNPEFAGLFATGGLIPRGQFGIVGERGPEPVFSTPGGAMVLPNSALRGGGGSLGGGGTNVSIPVSIDAAGADPAALERVRAQVARLQQDLPAIIVTTVQDAGDRRIFTTRNFR